MAYRTVLFGKPRIDSILAKGGLTAILENLGISSLTDIHRICYPICVFEFYVNLHNDRFDNFIYVVKGQCLVLNSAILHSILTFNVYSEQEVFNKKVLIKIDGFIGLELLKVVASQEHVNKFLLPTISFVLLMTHLVFMLCWSNICPRSENISNSTFQDLAIVSLILSGKAFDAANLILKIMYDVIDKTKTNFLYKFLMTNIFEFYQVDLVECEKVEAI